MPALYVAFFYARGALMINMFALNGMYVYGSLIYVVLLFINHNFIFTAKVMPEYEQKSRSVLRIGFLISYTIWISGNALQSIAICISLPIIFQVVSVILTYSGITASFVIFFLWLRATQLSQSKKGVSRWDFTDRELNCLIYNIVIFAVSFGMGIASFTTSSSSMRRNKNEALLFCRFALQTFFIVTTTGRIVHTIYSASYL